MASISEILVVALMADLFESSSLLDSEETAKLHQKGGVCYERVSE